MSYTVAVDFAPAYEFLISFEAFAGRRLPKTLELGRRWSDEVRAALPADAAAALEVPGDLHDLPSLLQLVLECPGERDVPGFLAWLAGTELASRHPFLIRALSAWEEHYFRRVDPGLLTALAAEADALRALGQTTRPVELVDHATGGVDLQPAPDLERVVLVPQFHYRPINVYEHLPGFTLIAYPADVAPVEAGAPPPGLVRLAGALADPSRLRILRFLAGDSRTFTEVQREMGLAKSTIHHHLVTLRAAGLIRVHDLRDESVRYSLRPTAVDLIGARLGAYLKER